MVLLLLQVLYCRGFWGRSPCDMRLFLFFVFFLYILYIYILCASSCFFLCTCFGIDKNKGKKTFPPQQWHTSTTSLQNKISRCSKLARAGEGSTQPEIVIKTKSGAPQLAASSPRPHGWFPNAACRRPDSSSHSWRCQIIYLRALPVWGEVFVELYIVLNIYIPVYSIFRELCSFWCKGNEPFHYLLGLFFFLPYIHRRMVWKQWFVFSLFLCVFSSDSSSSIVNMILLLTGVESQRICCYSSSYCCSPRETNLLGHTP